MTTVQFVVKREFLRLALEMSQPSIQWISITFSAGLGLLEILSLKLQ
jgi:hypothetical protein